MKAATKYLRVAGPVLAVGLGALLATGCASGPPESGFLSDYSRLERVKEEALVWEYADPEGILHEQHTRIWANRERWAGLQDYDRVLIEPVIVKFKPGARGTWVDPGRLNELTEFTQNAVFEAVNDVYPVVEEPGEGVLRYRLAITDVHPQVYYDPPDTDKHPARSWAYSRPGGAVIEAEILDSVSGEQITAMVVAARGSYYEGMDSTERWENVRYSLERGAMFFRAILDKAHGVE